jgi:hypothetical protein
MKTQTAVWIVIAVAVVGFAWYYVAQTVISGTGTESPAAATTTAPTTTTTAAAAKPAAKKPVSVPAKVAGVSTMSYLISLKEPLLCSVKTTTGYARSGTLYVADGKIRANFANSSMIDDGTHIFVWMTGAIKGLELLASLSASGSAIATNGGIDPANDISFSCNPWTVDASVFTPPASVSFFSSL